MKKESALLSVFIHTCFLCFFLSFYLGMNIPMGSVLISHHLFLGMVDKCQIKAITGSDCDDKIKDVT